MNTQCSKLNIETHRKYWRATIFLAIALLAICGSLYAADVTFQYDNVNGLIEADFTAGTQIAYDNDTVGNRLSEATALVSLVNQHLTIQYKVLITAPLQYSAEVSYDQETWDANNVSISTVPFNSQYNLVIATDLTAYSGTDPRYIRLDTSPAGSGASGSPGIDAPLLPFWASIALAIGLITAGLGVLKSRENQMPI